jgi:hypothetical protein
MFFRFRFRFRVVVRQNEKRKPQQTKITENDQNLFFPFSFSGHCKVQPKDWKFPRSEVSGVKFCEVSYEVSGGVNRVIFH